MDMHAADARRPAHEAALRAVQKPPAKPWRASPSAAPGPAPPKVYRVEPREFRDLVQRLTGAPAPPPPRQPVAPAQPVPVRPAVDEAQLYAPWFGFPMPMAASLDAAHGALI
ncbi:VQ motif-containing protein 29 [Oryza sativa Japonica Group]|uniref:Os12g0635400 protein n=2 Tax=Oryza sativa subsp. japonica TaxID=39947 RepID=C7JA34_ORYSJ|nr:VQ motif-containing protein 29 [Oryza sativa Japonica Group]BAH95805.1 Os12g0635400 [Oryza sativa Japonica Group]BAT18245.1 Os12g0635400 [Oryza sativa Japonica Group]|eukprot:NP_001177077.1 Os12g0635400 [Oryza sativa Japonica Group]